MKGARLDSEQATAMAFETDISLQKRLAPLHLIGACLIGGVVVFAGIALTMGPMGSPSPPATAGAAGITLTMPVIMRIVWGALALMQIPLAFFLRLPMINRAAAIRRSDSSMANAGISGAGDDAVHPPTFGAFHTASLISLALLESLALLGAITLLMSGDPTDLLLVGVPVGLMLAVFPTTGRWRNFDRTVHERAATGR